MNKFSIGTIALAAALYGGIISSPVGVLMASGDSVSIAKTDSPPNPGFSFRTYEQPRVLREFRFTDSGGRVLKLADFRGKLVLLNVWATWCPPCLAEMPALDRLQAQLGGPDFEVIALSIDIEGAAVVKDFYQELELTALRIYIEPSALPPPALNVVGLPTTFLIDREGKELGSKIGPVEWDSPQVQTFIRWYMDTANRARRGSKDTSRANGDSRARAAM